MRTPFRVTGVCHEKLKLVVITEVIWNIRGGVGAGNKGQIYFVQLHLTKLRYNSNSNNLKDYFPSVETLGTTVCRYILPVQNAYGVHLL